jgi:ribosomal protein L11 methyltransferase
MRSWLVVEVRLSGELKESVSNFLMEQGATGIEELGGDVEWQRLRTYFKQDGKEKAVLHSLHRYLKALQKIRPEIPRPHVKTTTLPEQDWGENWKRFFKPVQVTSKFLVKPPWARIRPKRGQIPIDITPGMAFGTGTHATTILCIEGLEERLKKRGLSVLDVGTGSGILSIVAAKLGAKAVLGIDIDGAAVENARENVERNHASDIVKIRKGRIGNLQRKFDVVVANIDFKGLKRMRRPLLNHLKNWGVIILSGILEGEKERLCQHYFETGLLQRINDTQKGEWVCLTFMKK